MLKRLLSRDTKGKVAERAKGALEADAPVTELKAETNTPSDRKPASTPQVRRKTKSMRDSDIKDEHGRSAEEIAAEAAEEFDIMGIAQRVNEMADRPSAKPAATPVADEPLHQSGNNSNSGEYGVPGKTRILREQAMAPAPAVQQPAPAVQQIVPPAQPVTALRIQGGHIESPGPAAGSADATLLARDMYWSQYGISDETMLGYETSPQANGAPSWPTARQEFRIIRTENSLIVATDGLSDPFDRFQGPVDQNGYGQELFIEVPGLQAATQDLIRNSWVFRAVEYAARLVAHNGGICDLLDEYGVMSLDVCSNCAPRDWIVAGVAEPAGALLDVPMTRGRNLMTDMPLSPVRVVPLTLIFPEELEDCLVGGPKERAALVNDLLTTGQGHKTDTRRASLR